MNNAKGKNMEKKNSEWLENTFSSREEIERWIINFSSPGMLLGREMSLT